MQQWRTETSHLRHHNLQQYFLQQWKVCLLLLTRHIFNLSLHPCRNSQRILHVPFFSPTKPASPSDLRTQEMLLKQARVKASASIGVMIALGYRLLSPEVQEYLDRVVLPVVAEHLSTVHFRVQKCYALLLTSAQQVHEYLKVCITFNFTTFVQPLSLALPTTANWLNPRGRRSDFLQRYMESTSGAATFCWW